MPIQQVIALALTYIPAFNIAFQTRALTGTHHTKVIFSGMYYSHLISHKDHDLIKQINLSNIGWHFAVPGMPFAVYLFAFDELRKVFVRRGVDNKGKFSKFVYRYTYY